MNVWNWYKREAHMYMLHSPPRTQTQTHTLSIAIHAPDLSSNLQNEHLNPKWHSKGKMNLKTLHCNGAEKSTLISQHKPCPGMSSEIDTLAFFAIFLLKVPVVFM